MTDDPTTGEGTMEQRAWDYLIAREWGGAALEPVGAVLVEFALSERAASSQRVAKLRAALEHIAGMWATHAAGLYAANVLAEDET